MARPRYFARSPWAGPAGTFPPARCGSRRWPAAPRGLLAPPRVARGPALVAAPAPERGRSSGAELAHL
eukprot:6176229-Alexandrium_andersonii.AAC.1